MILLIKGWPFWWNAHIYPQFHVHDILNTNFIDCSTTELESKWWLAMSRFVSTVTSPPTLPMILIWSRYVLKAIKNLLRSPLWHHRLHLMLNLKKISLIFYSNRHRNIRHTIYNLIIFQYRCIGVCNWQPTDYYRYYTSATKLQSLSRKWLHV